MAYVKSALFIYSEEGKIYLDQIVQNPHGSVVSLCSVERFRKSPEEALTGVTHVVVSAESAEFKEIIVHLMNSEISLGVLPLSKQRAVTRCYSIPAKPEEMIALALRDDPDCLDLVFCNEKILLFKATIGQLPLFDSPQNERKLWVVWDGLKRIRSLRLLPFAVEATGKNETKISTAASGCLILENPEISFASKMIDHDCSFQDGMISTMIIAPFSIVDYLKLMWLRVVPGAQGNRLPPSVGYIKIPEITIESEKELPVVIDGEKCTTTPAKFRVNSGGLRINHGRDRGDEKGKSSSNGERIAVASLPAGKELQKAHNKRVPFFTYASEERFRDLFTALRDDARLDSTYVVLMVLSTILATVGLFLNSASVIIGAMLLAPMMAPIISIAMSLLRYDKKLFRQSLWKIAAGIGLALFTALFFTVLSPYQPLTNEMQGRLNPTVLDLIVAIAAGVAGAYTKSFKEILQSLAGVAIAVALVPPLAVAGIGLGRFDLAFFSHAFLLFLTNLIGIILAATFTFRVLGYSPVVRDKKSILLVSLFFILIAIPLTIAFNGIIERTQFEKNWQHERFLVNGKYLIVNQAKLRDFEEKKILVVELYAREQLSRQDLNEFRRKVKQNFIEDMTIRAKIIYIP